MAGLSNHKKPAESSIFHLSERAHRKNPTGLIAMMIAAG
jgi:hypothetical protein